MARSPTADPFSRLSGVLGFMRLIWAMDHGLQKASKRMAAVLGLTEPQRMVMRILGRKAGMSTGAVAEILHLHPSTLTGIIRRLEERGVLRRERDLRDARRCLLYLTPKGRKLDASLKGTVEDAVRLALARSSPEGVEQASRLLEALAQSLSKMAGGRDTRNSKVSQTVRAVLAPSVRRPGVKSLEAQNAVDRWQTAQG